jgi:TonB-linked SusC/RagA family outer membrane protein
MQFSFAQEKTVSGVVSDNVGPIPGANVVVKGTTRSTQTDMDGKYSVKAKQGETLVFSFLGLATQEVKVGASNTVSVKLAAGETQLKEVQVLSVGYGKTTKEAYTGTATIVKKENIEAKTVSNISQALKGEVAGVNVITTSGQPGSDATIRIRGFGSVNGNRAPLYVVDGVPYVSDISALNPADIENMTILKDAAATSVYGTRGANGVILITTKTGKVGKSSVTVDFRTSVNSMFLPNYDVIQSPEEYIELSWEAVKNRGALDPLIAGVTNPVNFANANLFGGNGINPHYNIWNVPGANLINPATGKFNAGVTRRYTPEDWKDYAFRTGYRQEANVQFSGASDKTNYSTSFGFVDDEGFGINSDYSRYSARVNVNHKPADWLSIGANMSYAGSSYTRNGQSSDTGSIFLMANNSPKIYSIFLRDANGNKVADPYFGGYQYDYGVENERRFSGLTNGIADAIYDLNRDYVNTVTGNFSVDIRLAKGLKLETRYGAQYENTDANARDNPFYGSGASSFGRLAKTVSTTFNQNFLNLLRYNKVFGGHSIEAFAAHETTEWEGKYFSATKTNAILFNTLDLAQYTQAFGKATSYSQRYALESYFGQVNYNYNQKYFLTGSVRRDGSSRFKNNKWGTFGSVGAGWLVSKEDFMSKFDFLNFFKLKASYGVIGDQGTRIRYGWQIFSIDETDEYSFTLSSEQGNPNLTWETSKIAQVGFESSWFNNSLDVNVDYYVKNTENLYFTQQLPGSIGFNSIFINDGQLRNSGLEFDINAHLFKGKTPEDFSLSLGINGEFLTNKITQMPVDIMTGEKKIIDGNLSEGHSIYDFYMREWAGVDPANGAGLWNLYYDDVNSDGIFNSGDIPIRTMAVYMATNASPNVQQTTTADYSKATLNYVGKSAIPTVRGAFRLNASYKNFDLTAQFGYSIGGYAYDNFYSWLMDNDQIGQNNYHTDVRNRWQKPGDVTNVPRLSDNFTTDVNFAATSTRFLTKADYLALNNLKLGYNFPIRTLQDMNISKLSIYVTGDNLMMLSQRNGFNPSTSESGSSNIYRYNPLTSFSMGVKVEF